MNKLLGILFAAIIMSAAAVLAYTWMDADFNSDNKVDLEDASILSANLGRNDCNQNNTWCNLTDMTRDGNVNLADAGLFSTYLGCNSNSTNQTNCWV